MYYVSVWSFLMCGCLVLLLDLVVSDVFLGFVSV